MDNDGFQRVSEKVTKIVERCARCGRPFPTRSLGGNCPACLFSASIDDETATGEFEAAGPAELTELGDFEILGEIGRGGTSVVYRARQRSVNRTVALKTLHAAALANRATFERLQIEAQAVARLDDPHIVPLYEIGRHAGFHFLVLRHFERGSLAEALKRRSFTPVEAARFVSVAARAVHHAHTRGVMHRDLKPSNLLLDEAELPHVADFGLAKLADSDTSLTLSSSILGTPAYMAPEQAAGKAKDAGTPADIYSLGAVLFEMISGRPPFLADSALEVVRLVADAEPPRLSALVPSVDRDLEAVCLHCLEKIPERRYASASALADDLDRWLRGEPLAIRPPNPIERMAKWVRRRPLVSGLAALVVVAVAAGLAGTLWQWRAARRAAEAARLDAYFSAMDLAQRQFETQPERTREILDRYRPKPGETDLRGWEWRYFWDQTRPPQPIRRWQGQKEVFSTELSPDGRWLALGEMGGGAHLLDARTLQPVFSSDPNVNLNPAPFGPSGNRVGARLVFIPGANQLAWSETRGDSNCVLQFLDLDSKKIVRSWPQPYIVRNMAATPDGRRLVVSYQPLDGRTITWDVASGERVSEVPMTEYVSNFSAAQVLALSPDGQWMTVDDFPDFVRVMEVETGRLIWRFPLRNQYAMACQFSPDGKSLAVAAGFGNGTAPELWDLETGRSLGQMPSAPGFYTRLRFSLDGRRLYGSGAGRVIQIWDLEKQRLLQSLPTGQNSFDHVALADGNIIAAGRGAAVWNPDMVAETPRVHYLPLGRFWKFMPDSKRILGVTTNQRVALIGGRNWNELQVFDAGSTNACSVALLPDNASYLVGGLDGSLIARRWSDHQTIRTYEPMPSRIFQLEVDPKTRSVVALDMNHVRVFDLDAGTIRANLPEPMQGDNTPNLQTARGRWTSLRYNGDLAHINLATGAATRERLPFSGSEAFNYSPSGEWAATSGAGEPIRLYRGDWRFVRVVSEHTGGFYLSFSPDERRMAVAGSGENAVELWDPVTGRKACALASALDLARETHFSPDGNVIAQSGSVVAAVAVWQAPSWEEIARLESLEK